ncbi:16S rRNA (adenine(1518)-N(6)/adenine(1519)-N(6))-dimethyltransferase RsmA [Selenomonas noxia]|uniref:Ribosomal RNA small subunit methyltransferase A n=1 Tax=Selenomonas noxia F0398 TaxID=702437 RepID=A0ABN0DNS7_9FIRM|nr:16S rRNA (adenine(1518)-N(6)/adenine(1519)-N(6))-dimethyltransferase RsmA [Selenomonas noxia]EHG23940.1 dimethyladenosine transferase [Selenomonas noxia F0398]
MNASRPLIADPKVTRHILNAFHLRASKRLGQNFLVDAGVVQKIVAAAELTREDTVLEIGPGIGTLTQGLAETGARVVAVELDKKLPAVLAETLRGYDNVTVVPGDILKLDIPALINLGAGERFKVAANLPYYITTPILMALLEQRLPIERLVTMVQKEVAVRMTARPGSKDYGALSVAVQYFTVPQMVTDVPPRAFMPAPAVTSAVIACRVREVPAVQPADEKLFFRLIRAAFGQRRKTLLNALTGAGLTKEMSRAGLSAAGIAENMRGEQLSLEDFARLSDAVGNLKEG